MSNPTKFENTLNWAVERGKQDRHWGWKYWALSNTLKSVAWLCQIFVLGGLGVLLYLDESFRNIANIVLIFISCAGITCAVLLPVLSLERKSRIHVQTANEIELKLNQYLDGRLGEDEFEAMLQNVAKKREEQHD